MKNQTPKQIPLTYEAMMAFIYENERILTEKFAETDRILSKKFSETDRIVKENALELKKTDQIVKNLSKQLGGMGNSNGDVAETYFRNSFAKSMYFAGQDFDHIDAPLKRKNKKLNLQAEYDIVMYNGASVAIIEIKYKVDKEDVDSTLEKVQVFKKLFPQYQDYAIYLGLAGLSIEANAEKKAIKQGIGIIKQVGDTVVINDAHLKAY